MISFCLRAELFSTNNRMGKCTIVGTGSSMRSALMHFIIGRDLITGAIWLFCLHMSNLP